MRRLLALVPLAVVAAAAAPAAADPCVGSERFGAVCVATGWVTVDPTGSSIDDCIYVGEPPCTPVSVPFPTVSRTGSGCPVYTRGPIAIAEPASCDAVGR